jgi:hypothetical protein
MKKITVHIEDTHVVVACDGDQLALQPRTSTTMKRGPYNHSGHRNQA